ncbi:MAG: hypothetical protein NC115_07705 [Bacteroidales bacterium]|nr:hypothetical protein [Roseburia sp.]MCM1502534.1 hypothetical protein [Bacteroidales bacterium]
MECRVCFHSIDDLSFGSNLELVEKAIARYKSEPVSTLTDAIELFHIKKLIDNEYRLKSWPDACFMQLKEDVKDYNSIMVKHFTSFNYSSLKDSYNTLEYAYRQAFWDIIEQFRLYDVVDGSFVKSVAEENDLRIILHCKGVVEKFKKELKQTMFENSSAAHILIDKYIAKRDNSTDRNIYLPSNISMDDKIALINAYLDSDNPNLNYVRLICQNKDDKKCLVLDPQTRLKAERLAKKLNDELLSDDSSVTFTEGFNVVFSEAENIGPVDCKFEKDVLTYLYSVKYIRSCNHVKLVENCKTLFYWMNPHGLLELINKNSEVNTLEYIFMDRSRNAYPDYDYFRKKNLLASFQLFAYNKELTLQDTSLEQELKTFYEENLFKEYGYPSLKLNYPNLEDNWLNKCRVLLPELDSIVKQYDIYVKYDEIDPDIIRLGKPLKMTDSKSLLLNKYCEVNEKSSEIRTVLNNLFGSGSLLSYIKPFNKMHYHNLFDLLDREDVYYDNYEKYQKPGIDFLISHGIIKKSADGLLVISSYDLKIILKSLWEYRACAYWHYSKNGMEYIDRMVDKGWLIESDNLLTTEEKRYFSYYMDNGEFTNGFAYRNHYAHGSIVPDYDDSRHCEAYLVFLRLLAILILKIEDDLWCARRAFAIGAVRP